MTNNTVLFWSTFKILDKNYNFFVFVSIHPSIHTYIHTLEYKEMCMCMCVCVCVCVCMYVHLRSNRNIFTLTKFVTTKQLYKFTLTGCVSMKESGSLGFPHRQQVKITKYWKAQSRNGGSNFQSLQLGVKPKIRVPASNRRPEKYLGSRCTFENARKYWRFAKWPRPGKWIEFWPRFWEKKLHSIIAYILPGGVRVKICSQFTLSHWHAEFWNFHGVWQYFSICQRPLTLWMIASSLFSV